MIGDSDCPIHYPKFEYRYCEYCGDRLVEQPRDNEYDKYTGKQLFWALCPKRTVQYNKPLGLNKLALSEQEKHSRWIKELVTAS